MAETDCSSKGSTDELVPDACPSSVPPVMIKLDRPAAFLRVITVSTVLLQMFEYDVQLWLLLHRTLA